MCGVVSFDFKAAVNFIISNQINKAQDSCLLAVFRSLWCSAFRVGVKTKERKAKTREILPAVPRGGVGRAGCV